MTSVPIKMSGETFLGQLLRQVSTFQVCNCGPLPLEEVGALFYFWADRGGDNTDSTKRAELARQWDQTGL